MDGEEWDFVDGVRSSFHDITRFPTDGLSTRICGSVDFMGAQDMASELSFVLASFSNP